MAFHTFLSKNGRCLAWDYTCPDTLARTHIKKFTSTQAGKAASRAEDGKLKKYRHLNNDYYVVPIGIETLGSFGPHALDFIKDIGLRIPHANYRNGNTAWQQQLYSRNCPGLQEAGWSVLPITQIPTLEMS